MKKSIVWSFHHHLSDTFTYNGTSVTIQAGIKENVDDSWDTITYDSSQPFSEAPMFIADMQTLEGEDPVNIRVGGSSQINDATAIQLKLGEKKSDDNETGHVDEDVGWLAGGHGPEVSFTCTLTSDEWLGGGLC